MDGLHPSQMTSRPSVVPEQGERVTGKGKGKAIDEDAVIEDDEEGRQNGRNPNNDTGRTPEGLRPIRSLETGVIDVSVIWQTATSMANPYTKTLVSCCGFCFC
jgi:hypothetical protein